MPSIRTISVSGSIPSITQLALGDLAVNTYDGKAYLKKQQGNTQTVIEIGGGGAAAGVTQIIAGTNITISPVGGTGVVTINAGTPVSASYALSASYAATASYATNFKVSGSITDVDYIDFDTTASVTQPSIARLSWNQTDKTLDLGTGDGNTTLQIGQETVYPPIVNKDSIDLGEGTLVMVDPTQIAQGNRIRVVRAVSNGTYPSQYLVGILTEDITINQEGYATWFGYVRNLNIPTLESNGVKPIAEAWAEGNVLYPNPAVSGGLTYTQPTGPAIKSTIAVITSINGNNLTLLVRPTFTLNVGELNNVNDSTSTTSYGELFVKSGSVWTNSRSLTGSYSITGSLTISGSSTFTNIGPAIFSGSVTGTSGAIITGSLIIQPTSSATQAVAIIRAGSGSIALIPSGSGAIIAAVPDGTTVGGNARGQYAVDLQTLRSNSNEVAGASNSFIGGGWNNKITGGAYGAIVSGRGNTLGSNAWYTFIGSGFNNTINGSSVDYSVISGGNGNTVSSAYSTISGGQSNTASTNTHATVVGGQSNTASGQHSIAGGNSSTAGGSSSIALGLLSNASNTEAIGIGRGTASGQNSLALQQATASGGYAFATTLGNASGQYSVALGRFAIANSLASFAGPYSESRGSGAAAFCEGVAYGASSIVAGQYSQSQTTAANSSVFGLRSNAYLQGQNTNASGNFAAIGDAQQSLLTARREATLTTAATTILSLDGTGTTNLIIPNGNNRMWNVTVKTIVTVTTITGTATGVSVGNTYQENTTLCFKRVGGTSSIVSMGSTQQVYDASMSTAQMNYSAGASQELKLEFQAPTFAGGGSITCRVVSKVELTEVAY